MPITSLVFISNDLMCPEVRRDLRLPLHFVSFAIIDAQMYTNIRNDGVVNVIRDNPRANTVTYGAIFHVEDFDFHIRSLDAYHLCSLSSLRTNHVLDTQHRINIQVRPITFDSIDTLERLLYTEHKAVKVQAYIGNLNHPKLNRRIRSTRSARIRDNILVEPFLQLLREETV